MAALDVLTRVTPKGRRGVAAVRGRRPAPALPGPPDQRTLPLDKLAAADRPRYLFIVTNLDVSVHNAAAVDTAADANWAARPPAPHTSDRITSAHGYDDELGADRGRGRCM